MEDVGVMAFSGCTGLKEIVVADGNEYFTVHEGALFDKNLEVLYCYPAAQTETSYTVPDSTLVIGPSAFMCAASLTQVTLPEKLRYIGDGAFYGCVGLSSIILPEAVTTIGDNAFDSCSALQTVTFVGADAEEQTGKISASAAMPFCLSETAGCYVAEASFQHRFLCIWLYGRDGFCQYRQRSRG